MPEKPFERRTSAILVLLAGALLASPAGSQDPGVRVFDGLMWAADTNGEDVAWPDARDYCDTLDLEGYLDWRLPSLAEVETLYDPATESRLVDGFTLDPCCVWSATNLVELEAEAKGVLPDVTNDPKDYYWGFLFASGVRYYSNMRFPDGQALCVRAAG